MKKDFGTEKIEAVIHNYADMIYRIALHNLKNTADAEDILQEVSVALITKNPPLGDETHLKHWLIRTTINRCNSLHRTVWRKRRESLEDYGYLAAPQCETLEELWLLPKDDRNILYLYYYESYTIAEIAQILGKSPNTVGSRLRRARLKLKKLLTEEE